MDIDLLEDYERYLETNDLSPSSIREYVNTVRRIQRYLFENFQAEFMSEEHPVKGYMISKWASSISDLKITTRNQKNVIARSFLGFLRNMEYIQSDLTTALPRIRSSEQWYTVHPEDRPDKCGYTDEEMELILSVDTSKIGRRSGRLRVRAIVAVMVSTGLRVSELASLNVGDLGKEVAYIHRKGSHDAKLPVMIPKELVPAVLPYLQFRMDNGEDITPESPLFVSYTGRRMNRTDIWHLLKPYQEKLGLETGTHRFRHTALTAIAKDADAVVARDVAGQKNISVTNQYLHSTDEQKKSATDGLARKYLTHKHI